MAIVYNDNTTDPYTYIKIPNCEVYFLIQYLRYKKQVCSICTEVEMPYRLNTTSFSRCVTFISDVSCLKNGEWLEFEIKKSYSDFKKDFHKKSGGHLKHELVKNGLGPNRFCFVFPNGVKWRDKAVDYLEKNYPKYGVLQILDSVSKWHGVGDGASSVRPIRRLHSNPLDADTEISLIHTQLGTIASISRRNIFDKFNNIIEGKEIPETLVKEVYKYLITKLGMEEKEN